jgi:hypothetical protein
MRLSIEHLVLLGAGSLLGCGSPIEGGQPDGKDCNASLQEGACGTSSFCDPGAADANGTYSRVHKYADKAHPVGTCRPKGATGATCLGKAQCLSGECVYGAGEAAGTPGKCR